MQDDANHKLDCSIRFVLSRQLFRLVRAEAAEVKRRSVSEFVRGVIERYFEDRDARSRVPGA